MRARLLLVISTLLFFCPLLVVERQVKRWLKSANSRQFAHILKETPKNPRRPRRRLYKNLKAQFRACVNGLQPLALGRREKDIILRLGVHLLRHRTLTLGSRNLFLLSQSLEFNPWGWGSRHLCGKGCLGVHPDPRPDQIDGSDKNWLFLPHLHFLSPPFSKYNPETITTT